MKSFNLLFFIAIIIGLIFHPNNNVVVIVQAEEGEQVEENSNIQVSLQGSVGNKEQAISQVQAKVLSALTQGQQESCSTPKVPLFQSCQNTYNDQASFCCLRGCGCCPGQASCVIVCTNSGTNGQNSVMVACSDSMMTTISYVVGMIVIVVMGMVGF
jgi:hypothetical protein